jgi:hypothetical protein
MKKNILVGLTLVTVFSCTQQKIDTKSEGEKVMQTSREWSQIASTADIEKTLGYWADDAAIGCCVCRSGDSG